MLKRLFLLGLILVFAQFSAAAQTAAAKTPRDFFLLIPAEYFAISCCGANKDEFLKKYAATNNDFMQGGDTAEDPKYSTFKLRVFKRANGRYVAGFHSASINWSDYYFLEDAGGKLKNISNTIPQYSVENIYEFPPTTNVIKVYRKKYDSPQKVLNADYSVSKGKYLYDLVWQNDRFTVKTAKPVARRKK